MTSLPDTLPSAQNSVRDEDQLSTFCFDPNGLHDQMISIGDQYLNHGQDGEALKEILNELWDEVFYAARSISATDYEHDRLVTLILEARELGHMSRKGDQEGALLPNGERLWTDLPYLVQELERVWLTESFKFTVAERASLAAFTAKLCAVGVCSDELSRCALWLFKETLEVERPLRLPDASESNQRPSIVDLLPACLAWLRFNNFKLARLSSMDFDPSTRVDEDKSESPTAPGALAASAGVSQNGFTMKRWLFWRRQLRELHSSEDVEVMKLTKDCFEVAVQTGRLIGLEIPGEQQYLARVFEALDRELARREFVGSVEPSDIEIDMDWAGED